MVTDSQANLQETRRLFQEAVRSRKTADTLLKQTSSMSSPVIRAYHAAAHALVANHLLNPLKKLPLAQKSLSLFQQAVTSDPDHPEVRFLRLAITANMPAFLRKAEKEEDDLTSFLAGISEHDRFEIGKEDARAFLRHLLDKRLLSERRLTSLHTHILTS